MSIDEIIIAYETATETEAKAKKEKEYFKGLLLDYIKLNNIANPETIEKEKVTFETEEHFVLMNKNVQNRFDQTKFLIDFPDAKQTYNKPTLTISFTATEKATEKTA